MHLVIVSAMQLKSFMLTLSAQYLFCNAIHKIQIVIYQSHFARRCKGLICGHASIAQAAQKARSTNTFLLGFLLFLVLFLGLRCAGLLIVRGLGVVVAVIDAIVNAALVPNRT